jgi:phosphohistidine phosphatase
LELYLLRHGIAEDFGPGLRDADRSLTPEGKRKLRHIFKVALEAEARPTLILTSPYKRAQQTAELAAKHLEYEREVLETSALTPQGNPQDVWEEIRVQKDEARLLLVSHEPLVSSLSCFLLNSPGLLVDFKKGAMMRIDFEGMGAQPRGILKWYLTARLAN